MNNNSVAKLHSGQMVRLERSGTQLPLVCDRVAAGFPSPAEDYVEEQLSLDDYLVNRASATFMVRVKGDSMRDAGILEGDVLVVDRSLKPSARRIVLAVVNGEFTVKRLIKQRGRVFLKPENDAYSPIELTEDMDAQIWGVVTGVVRKC